MTIQVPGKPRYIRTQYGKEKLCTCCHEYYPENKDFFPTTSPSSRRHGLTITYENLCRPCYNARKRTYKVNAKRKKSV